MKTAITCKKAVDLISKKEEGKLSATQRVKLWQHLAGCSLCRNFSAQNKLIIQLLNRQPQAPIHALSTAEKEAMTHNIFTRDDIR